MTTLTRRDFLKAGGAAALSWSSHMPDASATRIPVRKTGWTPADELASLDSVALAELVRSGKVSPLELVDAAIARIERINPKLNAVVVPRFDKARAEAVSPRLPDGPFRGVPLLLKDALCHTAGDPHYEGMRFLKRLGWTEKADSYLAAKFRQAGFVFLGRTNTPELSLLPTCEPEVYGKARNPWNPEHSTGGSSGGSAAAVASHMVSVAHGTDAGGSIRIPASSCGVVGLRASRGRISLGPDYSETMGPMLTVYIQGVLTRTVRDSAAILDVISGGMPGDGCVAPPPARPYIDEVGADPGKLRIGVMTTMPGIETHPDCVEAADQAGKLLESLGHSVEELGPGIAAVEPPNDLDGYLKAIGAIRSVQAWHVDYWSRRTGKPIGPDDVEPYTWALAEAGRSATALDLLRGLEYTNTWVRQVARWWADGYDLLVTPTNTLPPPKLGYFDLSPDKPLELLAKTAALAAFSSFISSTGHPAVSLPLSWNADDLPIGVQLAAAYGREDILFRVASQLEQAQPWAERRPPLSA